MLMNLIKIAEKDITNHKFYLNHVHSMMKKFKETNNYLEEDILIC